MWPNSIEIFTSNAMQSNESDMLPFVLSFKERGKIGVENWFSGSFLEVFRLRRLTPYELLPNFWPNKRSYGDT